MRGEARLEGARPRQGGGWGGEGEGDGLRGGDGYVWAVDEVQARGLGLRGVDVRAGVLFCCGFDGGDCW